MLFLDLGGTKAVTAAGAVTNTFTGLSLGFTVFMTMDMAVGNVIVPGRREESFFRKHSPTWLVTIVLGAISALIGAVISYYVKN